jgi:hypothetical protein
LRKISVNALYPDSSPCIRVRRGDVEEIDIGFVGSPLVLDVATLMDFADGGTVFVTKWYNQNGSNNHAYQDVQISQHVIVWNGVLQTSNGEPAINSVPDGVQLEPMIIDVPQSVRTLFSVAQLDGAYTNDTNCIVGNSTNSHCFWQGGDLTATEGIGGFDGTNIRNSGTFTTDQEILYFNCSSGDLLVSKNDAVDTNTGTFANSIECDVIAGGAIAGQTFNGTYQEIIGFNTDYSLFRDNLIINMNSFYSTF